MTILRDAEKPGLEEYGQVEFETRGDDLSGPFQTVMCAGLIASFATLVPADALPVSAAPVAGLHYLVGTWKCTYRAGASRLAYDATWAYDRDGQTLRETASWVGGGDEELIAYDAQRHGWSAVVFDDQGGTTVMRAAGSDPNHMAYRSVYPDASLAVTLDRISASDYTLHGSVHAGGKRSPPSTPACAPRAR